MAALGISPARTVAAAAETPYERAVRERAGEPSQLHQATLSSPGDVVRDVFGQPIPGIPAPVRIREGVPQDQWTWKQHADYFSRQLGPRFYPGTEPPPPRDAWYQPSPNDPSEYVDNGDGTGYWRAKPDYQAKG